MTRRQLVLHEREEGEPGTRTIVAAFVIRKVCGRRATREVMRVEVHADGTVYSRRPDGQLERQATGALEQNRADALIWLSSKLSREE